MWVPEVPRLRGVPTCEGALLLGSAAYGPGVNAGFAQTVHHYARTPRLRRAKTVKAAATPVGGFTLG